MAGNQKTANGTQNNQPQPGSLFRIPKYTTQPRFVPDQNNAALATTLNAGTQVAAQTNTLDRLDILKSLYLFIDVTEVYTPGAGGGGRVLTQSPLFPYNFVNEIDVQFESAFKTFRLPGFLAAIMQAYRPLSGWKHVGMLANQGVNSQQGEVVTAAWTKNPTTVGLLGPSVTDATTPLHLVFEVPLSIEFDLYWELDKAGNPLSQMPMARAIVSPQYMSGTTRNVRPTVLYNPAMAIGNAGQALNSPVTKAVGDTDSTYAGTATLNVYRDGWYAPSTIVSTPPIMRWQYSRDYITIPTNGQAAFTVPLDSDPAGQGQIMSIVGCVWDPALDSGRGAMVPMSQIQKMELLFGSSLEMALDTPATNQLRWLEKHGTLPPPGVFGWDLALDDSGRLTNEFVLNTLITAGCQIRVTYNAGQAPSSTSTAFIGLEMLKAVSS